MSEQEGDKERREERLYASAAGEGAGEGVVAREGPITIEQYEGATTWGDLNDISLRKLAEGLVRIERRVAAIEERMVTKEDLAGMATKQDFEGMATKRDLQGMATKQDLVENISRLEAVMATKQDIADSMMTILRWNVSLILAGIAIMAGVTFGILQIVIANLP